MLLKACLVGAAVVGFYFTSHCPRRWKRYEGFWHNGVMWLRCPRCGRETY